MYLAIKNGNFKGVYAYDTKKERRGIAKRCTAGIKHKDFPDNQKAEALAWAGTKEVANRDQVVAEDVVKSQKKSLAASTHWFLDIVKKYKDEGYDALQLQMVSGKTIEFAISSFWYTGTLGSFYDGERYEEEPSYYVNNFMHGKEFVENVMKVYESRSCRRQEEDEVIYDYIFSKCTPLSFRNIDASGLSMSGNFVKISACGDKMSWDMDGSRYVKPRVLTYANERHDAMVNTTQIETIVPLRFVAAIKDPVTAQEIERKMKQFRK